MDYVVNIYSNALDVRTYTSSESWNVIYQFTTSSNPVVEITNKHYSIGENIISEDGKTITFSCLLKLPAGTNDTFWQSSDTSEDISKS